MATPVDFYITQFFRHLLYDLELLTDVYAFYGYARSAKRKSLKEFAQVVSHVLAIEYQEHELEGLHQNQQHPSTLTEEDSAYSDCSVGVLASDYLHDVILNYVLDDLSQFPFWSAKIQALTSSSNASFGMPLMVSYWNIFEEALIFQRATDVFSLFRGSAPYVAASVCCNFRSLLRTTHSYVVTMMKILPGSDANDADSKAETSGVIEAKPSSTSRLVRSQRIDSLTSISKSADSLSLKDAAAGISIDGNTIAAEECEVHNDAGDALRVVDEEFTFTTGMPGGTGIRRKRKSFSSKSGKNILEKVFEDVGVIIASQPMLVLSVNMVADPLYRRFNCFVAYFKLLARNGMRGLYAGGRARIFFSLIPLSPAALFGVTDMMVLWRMAGLVRSNNLTFGILEALQQICLLGSKPVEPMPDGGSTSMRSPGGDNSLTSSSGASGLMNLLNYGLLTAVHLLPGFASFVAIRCCSWLLFGSSIKRKQQHSRRKLIVEEYIRSKAKKKRAQVNSYNCDS